jgi:formylglycine-generating enzyme required for sulfatase activity
MAGNVWEWTHSLMKNYPYHSGDGREDPVAPNVRVLRGGSFKEMAWDGLCVVRRDNTFIRYFDDVGFRVCLAPSLTK